MKYLVDKYAGGYEEWAAQNPELIKEAKPEAEKGTEARNSPISPTSQSPFVEKSGSSQETADARPAGSRFARLRQRLLCR